MNRLKYHITMQMQPARKLAADLPRLGVMMKKEKRMMHLLLKIIVILILASTLVGCSPHSGTEFDTQKEFYEAIIQLRRFGGLAEFYSFPPGCNEFLNNKDEEYIISNSKPVPEDQKDQVLTDIIQKLTQVTNEDPALKEASYYLGVAHLFANHTAKATKSFEKYVSVKADYVLAYGTLALLYMQQSQYDEAFRVVQKLAEHHTDQKRQVLELNTIIALGMQDYPAAVNFAEKFVAFNPDDGHAHAYLGAAYLALRENEKADKQFSTALELDPATDEMIEQVKKQFGTPM